MDAITHSRDSLPPIETGLIILTPTSCDIEGSKDNLIISDSWELRYGLSNTRHPPTLIYDRGRDNFESPWAYTERVK